MTQMKCKVLLPKVLFVNMPYCKFNLVTNISSRFLNILFASFDYSRNKYTQSLRRAEGNKIICMTTQFFGDIRNTKKSRLKYKKYRKVKKHRRKACNIINKVVYITFCATLHESVLLTNFYYTTFMAAATTKKLYFSRHVSCSKTKILILRLRLFCLPYLYHKQ